MVSIAIDARSASLRLWRSVFERRAPRTIPAIEAVIGVEIGKGNAIRDIPESLLDLLTRAYREANGSTAIPSPAHHTAEDPPAQ
jgi:hypothetical protein